MPKAVLPLTDPQIEWHDIPNQPDATVHYGHEGIVESHRDVPGDFRPVRGLSRRGEGPWHEVFVAQRTTGFGRISGAEFTERVWPLWAFRSEKITRVQLFRDRAEALEAVGLSE